MGSRPPGGWAGSWGTGGETPENSGVRMSWSPPPGVTARVEKGFFGRQLGETPGGRSSRKQGYQPLKHEHFQDER